VVAWEGGEVFVRRVWDETIQRELG
jgi:hypothetical protein